MSWLDLHGLNTTIFQAKCATQFAGIVEAVELKLMELVERLLLGKARLINFLLGVKHVQQRA